MEGVYDESKEESVSPGHKLKKQDSFERSIAVAQTRTKLDLNGSNPK